MASGGSDSGPKATLLSEVAADLFDPELILQAVESHGQRQRAVMEPYVAPRTPDERVLAELWAQVIGLDQVGIHDDFFKLGGQSLLAVQLLSRVSAVCGLELSLAELFRTPTVAGLAARIAASRDRREAPTPAPAIRGVSREGDLPLSFAQQRQWFLVQLEPRAIFNIASAVQLRGRLDRTALQRACDEIVRRHEVLRTAFLGVDGRPRQLVAAERHVSLPLVDLRGLPETTGRAEASRLAATDLRHPFDLARSPLLRVTLLRLGVDEFTCLLCMHHVVSDAWSMGVLISEVSALYPAFREGRPSPLPELPIQYADYAAWERQRLRGEVLAGQLAYWGARLAGTAAALELPTDRPRGGRRSLRGARQALRLPVATTRALAELSRSEAATPFMTLLASWAALLHSWTRQEDIVIGAPVAGRNRPELERLIGCFLNVLPLRIDIAGKPSGRALLRRVREAVLGAFAHQDIPFEKLVEELRPERLPNRTPYFQVALNYYNGPMPELKLPDLVMAPVEARFETSKHELTLYAWEADGELALSLAYDVDLFERSTIDRMARRFERLLEALLAQPDHPLSAITFSSESENREQAMQQMNENLKRLKGIQRRTVALGGDRFVACGSLPGGGRLPLVVEPAVDGIDLAAWAAENLDWIERNLLDHGGILFRNFKLPSVESFHRVARAVCPELVNYFEGSSPRISVDDKIYTSTEYPAEHFVSLHNELSYAHKWPRKIFFFCVTPPGEGGETPIADSRQVLGLIDPSVRRRFAAKGVRYVRNLHGGRGPGLSWQSVFETGDRAQVEAYCREGGIDFRWKDDGGMWTSQLRPAVITHPKNGEEVWFNQVHQFHPSNLGEKCSEALLTAAAEDELPINSSYGDGSPLEPDALTEVRQAYDRALVTFPWRKGDLLLLDNMLVAHGRMPFKGPRRILVAMGETVWLDRLWEGRPCQLEV